MSNQPIGVFDSGIGGTSILSEIIAALPYENTIYLADSKNAPYGKKTKEEIIALSRKNTAHLLSLGCKLIVVACNTATTNAIRVLRDEFDVPFIGIEPAIKPASLSSKTHVIGILATQGTLNSALFEQTASTLNSDIKIVEQVGHGLVELIEQGDIDSPKMSELLTQYIEPILAKNADHLVLGCTHYPYLIPKIKEIVGTQLTIIDSGEAVARQTKNILTQYQLLNTSQAPSHHKIITNGTSIPLKNVIKNPKRFTIEEADF